MASTAVVVVVAACVVADRIVEVAMGSITDPEIFVESELAVESTVTRERAEEATVGSG